MEFDRKLSVGQYVSTPEFKSIQNHSCVCFEDDLGLLAVTGPADDKESQSYADLFAAAPELLDAIIKLGRDLELLSEHYEKDSFITKDLKAAYELYKKATGNKEPK